jgi:RimJ/RimL family protein N-acetyltransferase
MNDLDLVKSLYCNEALLRYTPFDVMTHERVKDHLVKIVLDWENHASGRALEQCGMRLEAYYRQKCRYTKNGVILWEDELEYARLFSE